MTYLSHPGTGKTLYPFSPQGEVQLLRAGRITEPPTAHEDTPPTKRGRGAVGAYISQKIANFNSTENARPGRRRNMEV